VTNPYGGVGWGAGQWGASAFGGPTSAALQLLEAVASRENAVQLLFNHPVYFTGLDDISDAGLPSHYDIEPVAGTFGSDEQPTRLVTAASVAVVTPVQPGVFPGSILEVTLDRPMTPFPSVYTVTVSGLFTADMSQPLDPGASSLRFQGVFKEIEAPQAERAHPRRDLANPQTASALAAANVSALFGSYAADSSGDYAFDEGLVGFKKRILRRYMTKPGGFLHLGVTYGVGLGQAGKRLSTAATRAKYAAEAEKQIAQEPETQTVRVTTAVDSANPGLVRFRTYVKPKAGQPMAFDVPLRVR
jgi:hypothetical protein